MSDFDPHITIDDRTDAKDLKCVAKTITIDTHRMKIDTPIKVLSGKAISDKTANTLLPSGSTPIFELTKTYELPNQYTRLINTLQYGGKNKDWIETLNSSFSLRRGLESTFRKNITASSVFQYYPIDDLTLRTNHQCHETMAWDIYHTYLDYIYSVSSAFILTPDVVLPTPQSRQISIQEYLQFIENSVQAFERQNNKPIFVPLQIDLAAKDLDTILTHYKDHGYTNIWINFKAKKCDGSNAGKLRVISRLIEQNLGTEAVIYCSQIKRQREVTQKNTPAFDMLPPLLSADFVGVNRTRPARGGDLYLAAQRKGFGSVEEYQNAVEQSNCSLFNPATYMYSLQATEMLNHREESFLNKMTANIATIDFFNGIRIDQELSVIKSQIHEEKNILPYLETKEGVKNNMEIFGNASKDTSTPGRPVDLFDFF